MRYIIGIRSLAIFYSLKKDRVISCLCTLLEEISGIREKDKQGEQLGGDPSNDEGSAVRIIDLYSRVISALYPHTSDLGLYIRDALLADDNFYVRMVACGKPVDSEIRAAIRGELKILEELAALPCDRITKSVSHAAGELPKWTNSPVNLAEDFSEKLKKLPTTGYGIFAEYDFFRISEGEIVPVPHPDVQQLSELFGYERQKEQIIRNTEALLSPGLPSASNMLLYGDAGTGKSSTIKAVAGQYADRGIRLIEIKKDQLMLIPMVLETISDQPLKFILFIDDLSFTGNDDNFSALKATLEGSVAGRGDNAVVYATSNRRHLVKETFADRTGDELHVNDTLQETMSLAARFGLTVIFEKPEKDEYLDIVRNLAKLNGIHIAEDELVRKAEAHAIRKHGRSPRTARQFIELLKIGL